MYDRAIGRAIRVIRLQLGLRQADLAARAGCSQQEISRIECGELDGITFGRARRICRALDASLAASVRWRGGELDRLLDEDHAVLVGVTIRLLRRLGWETETEVSFSVYGERGSIDILAWHGPTRTLLVIEVKTEVASIEEQERRLDAKVRLAAGIWRERTGQHAAQVGRLLVVGASTTNRRRVTRHDAILGARYPVRGRRVEEWLRAPSGALAGLLFATPRTHGSRAGMPRTVRRAHAAGG